MNKLVYLIAAACIAGSASAQTSFPEIEPNGAKSQATVVSGITAGDSVTGVTTGVSTTLGSTLISSADMFRVKTAALPVGIYRHRLTLSTATTAGHTGTIRGVNQTGTPGVGGIAGTNDTELQVSQVSTFPPRYNQWFGFGKQEEIYYRVTGVVATTSDYVATMSTTAVAANVIAPHFESGSPITFTTVGQTTVDTELMLFDGSFTAIPGALNDDEGPVGLTLQSRLTRTLAPGTYYLALGPFGLATNQVSAADDDFVTGPLTDFPDCVVDSNTTGSLLDLDFQIIAGNGIVNQSNHSELGPFLVTWFQFTMESGAPLIPTPTNAFCLGDGTGAPCPCANFGAAGNGCANATFPAGGNLTANGNPGASNATDTLELTATNIPGPGLFFQASGLAPTPIAFGDGLLCANVGIVRLGVGMPSGGSTSYPAGGTPIHTTGSTQSGDTRHYQVWYRSGPTLCGAGNYDTTQGISLTWGP